MGAIVYSSPFVPAEWIEAHGFVPCRVAPKGDEAAAFPYAKAGVCPYAAAFAVAAARKTDASAIVVATSCDQMRRMSEWIGTLASCPVFTFHVPTIADAAVGYPLYRDEILRLGRFLARMGGTLPTREHLAETMLRFDDYRRRLLGLSGTAGPRGLSEALIRFQEGESADMAPAHSASGANGVPLALVGGPLTYNDQGLFDTIANAGGKVVLDATTTGERTLPRAFDRCAVQEEPLHELANAYFGAIPDAFRRPNTVLYAWLDKQCKDRGVRGVIFRHYVWCDTWQVEAARVREMGQWPVLVLDAAGESDDSARAEGRIRAFLEALR